MARVISAYTSVTSRPERAISRAPPSRTFVASTRAPSYFSSKIHPSRVNGRSAVSASIGSRALAGSDRAGAFAARASAVTSSVRVTWSRRSITVSPETTDSGCATTISGSIAAPFTFESQSQLLPPSPFMRTSAKRPRSL